jgi:hypothetical protein
MSDMAKARDLVGEGHEMMAKAQLLISKAHEMIEEGMGLIEEGLAQTYRASPVRRAEIERVDITDDIREAVFDLAQDREMTTHQIAEQVGLRNGGRVSEILNGKR